MLILTTVLLMFKFTGDGVDYSSGPYSITFTAGDVRRTFSILIRNEREKENNENFTLTIDLNSLQPCEVTVGSPSQSTVNIEDDDCE